MFKLKSVRRGAIAILCGSVIFTTVESPAVAAPPTVLADTYATVVIGDIPAMINRSAGLANRVNPGISGQALRGQIGMFLGDAGMKSIPAGAGLLLAIPVEGKPFALLETADGKNADIAEIFQRRGRLAVKTSGDNLIIAAREMETLDALDSAQTSAAADMLKASNDPSLVITLDTDRLARIKGPEFKRALKGIGEKIAQRDDSNSTSTVAFLNLFGNFVLAVGQRADVATVNIDISAEGISFDRSVYPVSGLNLGEAEGPTGQELRKGLAQPGKVLASFDYYLDTESALKGLAPFFDEVLRGSNLSAEDRAEIKAMFDKAAVAYGDGMTGWAGVKNETCTGGYVFSVNDAKVALEEIKGEIKSLNSGAMGRFYKHLGLETSASLQQNNATVQEQPAHSFSMKMVAENGEGSKIFGAKDKDYYGKFVFLDNKMILAMGDVSLEDQASAAAAGNGNAKPVQARSKLDAGGFIYVDFYPGALADAEQVQKFPPAKRLFEAIGDDAIYQSAYVDNERIRSIMLIPGDLIENAVKALQKAKVSDSKTTGTE